MCCPGMLHRLANDMDTGDPCPVAPPAQAAMVPVMPDRRQEGTSGEKTIGRYTHALSIQITCYTQPLVTRVQCGYLWAECLGVAE